MPKPTYTLPTVAALTAQYESYLVRDMGSADHFASVLENARNPGFASEHDYIDANMTMHDALVRLVRDLNPGVSSVDIENWAVPFIDDDGCPMLTLWNAASEAYLASCAARVMNWDAFCMEFGVIDPNGYADSEDARTIRSSFSPTNWIDPKRRWDDSGDNAWCVYVWDGDGPTGFDHMGEAFNLGGILVVPARGNAVVPFLDNTTLDGFEAVGIIRTIKPSRAVMVDLDLDPALADPGRAA